ncbi:uncharacterized protein LOC110452378 [Mizuhopecten yessoensis]|uniref:uncharacterized protein LOC110452378 n=1 Tax=Mizuhopecten yessoensis TaxID=6573 RepID=UPI000B457F8F|nr:uncharacterized protein LOC110452378 [Mizuhopecten yessoensis]
MWHTMDSKYDIVFMCFFLTLLADCVFSQAVNNTGCVTNSWHQKWKSCYTKHCGTDPGICISSRGTPVCRRVKDNCGMCVKRWFVDNQVIECERTTASRECPPNIILRNCPTNLCNNVCSDRRFNGAPCRVNRCGACTPEYSVSGLWMMCPSQPFSPVSANNDLTGLSFFHPEAAGAGMAGNALPAQSISTANSNFGLPQIARAVSSSNSFRSAGPGDVPEPSRCAKGITERICQDLCANAQCENYPNAVCRINSCGTCRAEFYIGDERVNCRGQKCPAGVTYFHTCDSCAYNYCHNYPTATCRMDACGKCKATFWLNGNKEVKCVEQNILDPCPDNLTKRWTCLKPACHFDTCPMNSSVSCITNNCGGCMPRYIHKITKEVAQCRGYWTQFEGKGMDKGHVATEDEIRRVRADRDRQLRQSQVALENTNSRIIEQVNQVRGSPDSPSTPERPFQIRPVGGGQNRNQQGGFVNTMVEQSRRQSDPNANIDLSPRQGSGSPITDQDRGFFMDLLSQIDTPLGVPSQSSVQSTGFGDFGRRMPSSGSPKPSDRQFSRRLPAQNNPTAEQQSNNGLPANNDPRSDVLRGSERRRPSSSGSSRPSLRHADTSVPLPNSPTQNAQRSVPVVADRLIDPVVVRTEQVPANNVGLENSFPVVQQRVSNPGIPLQHQQNVSRKNRQENTQAVAEIDKIIHNLDSALRKAHPPRDRSTPTASRPLSSQKQRKVNSPLMGDSLRAKPVITSAKKRPSEKLSAGKKNAKLPLSSRTTDKPSLHKTKSIMANKPIQRTPRRNPDRKVKNAQRKEASAAAAKKAPSKPEQKTASLGSLMFPAEFLSFFQSLGGGNAFAIPNKRSETPTRKI